MKKICEAIISGFIGAYLGAVTALLMLDIPLCLVWLFVSALRGVGSVG